MFVCILVSDFHFYTIKEPFLESLDFFLLRTVLCQSGVEMSYILNTNFFVKLFLVT